MSMAGEISNQPRWQVPKVQWSPRAIFTLVAVCGVLLTLLNCGGVLTELVVLPIAAIVSCAAGIALSGRISRGRRFAASCVGLGAGSLAGAVVGAATVLIIAFTLPPAGATGLQGAEWPAVAAGAYIGAWVGLLLALGTLVAFGCAWLVSEGLSRDPSPDASRPC